MIDVVDLKAKKFVFIDELSFGFPLDLERDNIPATLRHGSFVKASEVRKELKNLEGK